MPRLTEAEADDLARQALIAMAVDEFRSDLRAQVKALLDEAKSNATSTRDFDLHRYYWVFAEGVEAALALIDGSRDATQ